MDITYAVEHAHDENILTHELPLDKEVESKNLPREHVQQLNILIDLVLSAVSLVHAVAAHTGAALDR